MNPDTRAELVESCATALAESEMIPAFLTDTPSPFVDSVRESYRVRARTVLNTAGRFLCDDIDRQLRDGVKADGGWVQGVKQAGEDMQRCWEPGGGR